MSYSGIFLNKEHAVKERFDPFLGSSAARLAFSHPLFDAEGEINPDGVMLVHALNSFPRGGLLYPNNFFGNEEPLLRNPRSIVEFSLNGMITGSQFDKASVVILAPLSSVKDQSPLNLWHTATPYLGPFKIQKGSIILAREDIPLESDNQIEVRQFSIKEETADAVFRTLVDLVYTPMLLRKDFCSGLGAYETTWRELTTGFNHIESHDNPTSREQSLNTRRKFSNLASKVGAASAGGKKEYNYGLRTQLMEILHGYLITGEDLNNPLPLYDIDEDKFFRGLDEIEDEFPVEWKNNSEVVKAKAYFSLYKRLYILQKQRFSFMSLPAMLDKPGWVNWNSNEGLNKYLRKTLRVRAAYVTKEDYMKGVGRLAQEIMREFNLDRSAFEPAVGAHLAVTTAPVVATPIPTTPRTVAQKGKFVTFVARVIRAQKRTGSMMVDDTLLHVVIDAQGRYWLEGLGMSRVINPKNIRPAGTDRMSREKVQVKLPMSDYTRMLGEADRSVNEFFEDLPESITQTKVVEIFDLNILPQEAFGPNLTYLLRRYILEKKQDPNFVVLFGGDSWKIEQAMAEVYDLPVDVQKLFISKPADLPQAYKDDIDNVRVISMDGFKDGKVITAKLPIIGKTPARHFIVKVLDKNDIMHPAVHRAARLAARVPELTPERKGYFERLVRVYETLLGHKIDNTTEFIRALEGDEIPNLSHYVVLALLHLDNALRLLSQAARMAEQSA